MFLAIVFVKTGNIKITIALHALINFISSVLLTGLISKLDVDQLMQYYGDWQMLADAETYAAMMAYVSEHLLWILAMFVVVLLQYGLAFAGILLLIINWKKLVLRKGEVSIPKGKWFLTIFCNLGMGLFVIFGVLRITLEIF